jgi:hypothetical protein
LIYKQDSPNVLSNFRKKMFRRSAHFIRADGNFTDWNDFPRGGFYWEEHEKSNLNNVEEYDYETKH